MTQTIWIARHANRLDFVNPEWFNTAQRPYDPPLSDDGVVQAQELAKRLRGENISHIFASPFLRTIQTAHQVAEVLDLPVKPEWGLSEWLNPAWMPVMPETLSIEALQQQFPRVDITYHSRVIPKYPETDEECLSRAGQTALTLAQEFSGDLLLVGHGASVLGSVVGLTATQAAPEVKVSLCCLFKLVRHPNEWVLELNGDISHLSQTEKAIRFH